MYSLLSINNDNNELKFATNNIIRKYNCTITETDIDSIIKQYHARDSAVVLNISMGWKVFNSYQYYIAKLHASRINLSSFSLYFHIYW